MKFKQYIEDFKIVKDEKAKPSHRYSVVDSTGAIHGYFAYYDYAQEFVKKLKIRHALLQNRS